MLRFLNPPLLPRSGHTLRGLLPCRVSDPGPGKQDERSPQDQEAMLREWLNSVTNLPCDNTVLAGSGSGELLDRAEYLRLIELVESDEFDFVLTEDLGRIVRRIHAHLFCELCVDHNVRVIALNDNVDTAQDGWQDRSIFSAWHHERSNRDTSDRIKRTHRARFVGGGCLSLPIYGYYKKAGIKSDMELEKVPEAEAIYKEWFRKLDEDDATYTDVADWLNELGIPTGPHCKKQIWDCQLVGQVTHNPILKGIRVRNRRKTVRNSAGKYNSRKAAPDELLTRQVPHLAFLDEVYFDRVIKKVDARNAKYRRKGVNGQDTRRNVPKKKTRWPGQHIFCGVCGRLFVFGGHGQKEHLMCTGARLHKCWQGMTVDGPLAVENISKRVFDEIAALTDFDSAFVEMAQEEARALDKCRESELHENQLNQDRVTREIANMMKFIRGGDVSPSVRAELARLETDQRKLAEHRDHLERTPTHTVVLPTAAELKQLAAQSFEQLAHDSFEFARLMRQLIPKIVVFPFRLYDGGHVVLRAKCRLQLSHLLSDSRARDVLRMPLERILEVDLFKPPQREQHRQKVAAKRAEIDPATGKHFTVRKCAVEVGITLAAAQRAAALQGTLNKLGISDSYLPVLAMPDDYGRLWRHKNVRYRFEPLPDAGQF